MFRKHQEETFYASLGFRAVERIDLTIGGNMKFPTITMIWTSQPTTEG
jgi:hypothetical protein